eukprot:3940534-Rhodomonas_salina.2
MGSTELKQFQNDRQLDEWLARQNRLFIQMLRKALKSSKVKSKDVDILLSILFTQELDKLMMGSLWKREWNETVWQQQAVKIWIKILVLQMSTGKEEKSVREIMSKTEKLMKPLMAHFRDLKAFQNYVVACMGAETVQRKALQSRAAGKVDSVKRALHIAETHISKADDSSAKVLKTDVSESDERQMKATEEQQQLENPLVDFLPAEIELFKTFVSQYTPPGTDGNPKEHKGDANKGKSHRCGGGWKECPKCWRKHPGVDKGECFTTDRIMKHLTENKDKEHRVAALTVLGLDNKAYEQYSSFDSCKVLLSRVCHRLWGDETVRVYVSGRRAGCVYSFVDTASQGHVVATETGVKQRTGRKLKLQGATGDVSYTEEVEIRVDAPTIDGSTYTILPTGQSMYTLASSDNILSHALLKQQGYQIDFA